MIAGEDLLPAISSKSGKPGDCARGSCSRRKNWASAAEAARKERSDSGFWRIMRGKLDLLTLILSFTSSRSVFLSPFAPNHHQYHRSPRYHHHDCRMIIGSRVGKHHSHRQTGTQRPELLIDEGTKGRLLRIGSRCPTAFIWQLHVP